MKDAGFAHIGTGSAAGKDKAAEAAREAISSPLLETSIDMAHGVIVSVIGSDDIGLDEVETAATMSAGGSSGCTHHLRCIHRREHGRRDPRCCNRNRFRQCSELRKDEHGRQ